MGTSENIIFIHTAGYGVALGGIETFDLFKPASNLTAVRILSTHNVLNTTAMFNWGLVLNILELRKLKLFSFDFQIQQQVQSTPFTDKETPQQEGRKLMYVTS